MIKTEKLQLPIYDAPLTDTFNLADWNTANVNLENAYKEITDFRRNIPLVNANAEIIEARGGNPTLKAKIDSVDAQLAETIYLELLGAKGDANYYDTVTKLWYQDAQFTKIATDNTAIIQSIFSSNRNKKIRINGAKKFKISDSITITAPIILEGGGYMSSMFVIDSEFPEGKDVLVIQPTSIGSEPFLLQNFGIYAVEDNLSRDAIRVINSATQGTNELFIEKCFIRNRGTGRGVNAINDDANLNPNGIPFIRFKESKIWDGVKIQNAGDSCVFEKLNIKGKNIGLEISMVKNIYGWSSNLSILDCNIVNDGGAIKLSNVRSFFIERNNIEQRTLLEGGYAVIIEQISDDAKILTSTIPVIEKNKIECASPGSRAGGVKLVNVKNLDAKNNYVSASPILGVSNNIIGTVDDFTLVNCENVKVEKNELYISRGCVGVRIDSTSKDCVILNNSRHYFNKMEAIDYIDEGIGTMGIPRILNSSNFENYSASNTPLTAYRDEEGYVTLYGSLKVKTGRVSDDFVIGDLIIDTLPSGFIPEKNHYVNTNYQNIGGLYNPAYWRIMSDGTVRLNAGISDVLVLFINGVRYKAI